MSIIQATMISGVLFVKIGIGYNGQNSNIMCGAIGARLISTILTAYSEALSPGMPHF